MADWSKFYKEAYRYVPGRQTRHRTTSPPISASLTGSCRHTRPGGYIEQVEQSVWIKSDDGTIDGTVFERWGQVSLKAGEAFGKSLRVLDESAKGIKEAGFTDVVERRFKVPIGPWPKDPHLKELGRYNRLQWEEGIEGWTMMLLTKVLGVSS